MAEDKGAGGSSWGPLEIALVLLLVIAVLDRLSGKNLFSTAPGTTKPAPSYEAVLEEQKNYASCGLVVTNPKPLQKISGAVSISGRIEGCNWNTTEDAALYAQVIDSKGRPVSEYQKIAPTASLYEITFQGTVYITGAPTGTGYLILVPAVQPNQDRSISSKIPIKF
jgi:hypothetical protein